MENKKMFIERQKVKIADWKAEVESFQANADKIDQQSSGQYSSAIMELIGKIQRTENKFIVIDQSPTDKWHELKHGVVRAMADIEESVRKTKKRFNL
jgi:hypothetical protein